MLAAAIGVDRAVERDIGRLVETDDRAGVFLGHRRAQWRGRAVDDLALIQPVQISLARSQPEALRDMRTGRAATVDEWGHMGD